MVKANHALSNSALWNTRCNFCWRTKHRETDKRLEIYQKPSYDKQHVSDYLDENFEGMILVYYILGTVVRKPISA